MIPGIQSKLSVSIVASTTTMDVQTDVVMVTGSVNVATINPPKQGGFNTVLFFVPTDAGNVTFTTAGNIAIATTASTNKVCVLIYDQAQAKWYPNV